MGITWCLFFAAMSSKWAMDGVDSGNNLEGEHNWAGNEYIFFQHDFFLFQVLFGKAFPYQFSHSPISK